MTGLSRAGFYRARTPRQASAVDMEIRDEMYKTAVTSPAYGERRITVELQHRGFAINHKRVLRMMRNDNLLCVRRRKFVVTTDSRHNLPIYLNLAGHEPGWTNEAHENEPALGRGYHLYPAANRVRLPGVVLDAFSRRVIAWALGRSLDAGLPVAALEMALQHRHPQPGLVHHSDRGIQYASLAYTEIRKRNQIQISMSRKGNVYDNAACESFMKTLKYEEVFRNEYRDFQEARASIGEFLERVYNQKDCIRRWGIFRRPSLRTAPHDHRKLPNRSPKRGLCPCHPGI
jgi:putative transposase